MSSTARIRVRRGTAAAWTAANPILALGELGFETDTKKFKLGDGILAWNALAYYIEGISTRGQASRTTDGVVNSLTQGVYKSTGLTATFDSATAYGMSLGTTDLFGLKNTSGATQLMLVYASVDASDGNNKQLGIKLAKNGTVIDQSEARTYTGNSSSEAHMVTSWMVSMAANDEVSIFIANHSGTDAITIKRARLLATEVH